MTNLSRISSFLFASEPFRVPGSWRHSSRSRIRHRSRRIAVQMLWLCAMLLQPVPSALLSSSIPSSFAFSLCLWHFWLFVSVPNGFVKLFTDSLCSIFPAWSFLGWGEIKKLFLWACRDSAGAGFCTAILLFRTKWLWATFKRVSCAENLRKIQMQHAPTLRVASAAFWAESWRIFNEKLEIKLMKMRGNG